MSNMRFVFALVVLLLGFVADVVDASAPEFCQCVTCRKRGVEPASLCVAAQLLCVDYLLGGIYESDVDCGACCERLYAASKEVNPDDGSSTIQKYCAMLSYEDIKQELDDETAATQGDAPPPPPPPRTISTTAITMTQHNNQMTMMSHNNNSNKINTLPESSKHCRTFAKVQNLNSR
eukprot:c3763_g1_i1.p1 GENE.c3763_g1_i1~~c3763_g1_i1.p1  ORF type:complete len:191 (+),score=74.57 c3763_g1_i1:43-573(+)